LSLPLVLVLAAATRVVLNRAQRTVRAAEQAHEHLRAVIDATPLGLTLIDAEGRVRLWNPGAVQIFGWTAEEVLGRRLPTVPAGGWDAFRANLASQMRGNALTGAEFPAVRKDGSAFEVRVWTAPFRDRRGRIVASLGIIADISESKRLEAELRQAQKLESIAKLAGGIAHDFNNLLTIIGAQYELALAQLDRDHPVRDSLEQVRQATQSASALTRQLLAFSRKQLLQTTLLDPNEVILSVAGMLRSTLGEDIEFVTDLEPGLPAVLGDRGQLEQVLMNLVINAREAMPDGGRLAIKTRAIAQAEREPDEADAETAGAPETTHDVEITVTDTGAGMTSEAQAHAFEPFYTTKEDGSGLGLATVYGVIRQLGGSVAIESTPGTGARFSILLPGAARAPAPSTTTLASPDHRPGDGPVPAAIRVLVVEDDDLLRGFVRELLTSAGFDVLEAASGEQALAALEERKEQFDVLLTDVVMPHMSGRELAQRVRAIDERCAVVFTSGYDAAFDTEAAALPSDAGVLPKPFTSEQLIAVIRATLAHDHAPSQG
jgi:PAS domain S-box-containing protein